MPRRTLWQWLRRSVRRWASFLAFRVLHADDTPHRIALGMAVGAFVTLTPTIGLQMVLVVALCTLLRANRLVGVPLVWISNPATIVPLYYPSYRLGTWLLPQYHHRPIGAWRQMARDVFGRNLSWWDRVQGFWQHMTEVAVPLWVGSIILGVLAGAVAYGVTYAVVGRARRLGALRRRKLLRIKSLPAQAAVDPPDAKHREVV